ncbi:MAG: hypothetical protein M3Q69_18565 [Acidobacteriota bacterium]|nr:hypothetical protein [Acidobacteriota bacterium]
MPASISEPLSRLVRERLPSLEQIEIVLLLSAEPRGWNAVDVSQRLGTPPESTAMRLFLLASNGVITFDSSAGIPQYRFSPDAVPAPLLAELEEVHRTDRAALAALVGGPADPLRTFADAFRFKK